MGRASDLLKNLRVAMSRLDAQDKRSLGWNEFINAPADTEDAVELAEWAIDACCFDEDGDWRNCPWFFTYLVLFVSAETEDQATRQPKHIPSKSSLESVIGIVQGGRANLPRVKAWFEAEFRPFLP